MQRSRIAAALVCAALLFLISGCVTSEDTKSTLNASAGAHSPHALYQQAADAVSSAESLSLYIGTMTQTTVENQTFSEASQQYLQYRVDKTKGLQAAVEEVVLIGTHKYTVSEVFTDNTNYFTVNDSPFRTGITGEAYRSRFAPAAPFDPNLYGSIQTVESGARTCIIFSQPTAAEVWSIPEDAVFLDASGYAMLNSGGALTDSTYTVTYTVGSATVSKTFKIIICSTDAEIPSPSNSAAYITLEHADAPRWLEQACGYLLQAGNVKSQSSETITCQAFSINRTQTTSLSISGEGQNFQAVLDTNVTQINQSLGGAVIKLTETEHFQNGMYSISENGSVPAENPSVDYASMNAYCEDFLVNSIILPKHIGAARLSETETTYKITFQANQLLAEAICADICDTLYNEPALLDTLASASTANTVECYLELDKQTGLPVSSGLSYSATHTIEAISYQLTSQRTQAYQYK